MTSESLAMMSIMLEIVFLLVPLRLQLKPPFTIPDSNSFFLGPSDNSRLNEVLMSPVSHLALKSTLKLTLKLLYLGLLPPGPLRLSLMTFLCWIVQWQIYQTLRNTFLTINVLNSFSYHYELLEESQHSLRGKSLAV